MKHDHMNKNIQKSELTNTVMLQPFFSMPTYYMYQEMCHTKKQISSAKSHYLIRATVIDHFHYIKILTGTRGLGE